MTELGSREWRVIDVREGKTEPNPHGGEFQKFYVDFEDAPDTYWRRNKGDTPEIGKSYYGTVSKGEYGLRFKKEKKPDFSPEASTGSAGSSNKGKWQPEQDRDPEKSARITRMHSEEMAVRVLTAMGSFEKHGSDHQRWIKDWADFFDADVAAAGEAAKQGAEARPNPTGSPPVATSAPAPPPAGPSFTELGQALNTAGLFGAPGDQVTAYMAAELKPEQQDNAIRKLIDAADPDTQAKALQSLKTLTEKWQGAPLATDEVDEDIPF